MPIDLSLTRRFFAPTLPLVLMVALACSGDDSSNDESPGTGGSAGADDGAAGASEGSGGGGAPIAGASGASGAVGTGGTAAGSGGASGGAGVGGSGQSGGAGLGGTAGADTGPQVDRSMPKLYELKTRPEQLDPKADKWLADEYGYLDTRVAPIGKLAVVLAGAGGTPAGTLAMQKLLAGYGFHVLSPHYADDYLIVDICAKSTDKNCYQDLRLEAFEGVDHTPEIDVSRPNSLEQRAAKMLAAFAKQNPQGDWGYFLEGDQVRWQTVVVTGISHGASSSGVIGKVRETARVVMASGPLDQVGDGPSPWQGSPSKTPEESYYGFSHTADPQHPGHLKSWAAMKLVGPPASVDGASPPFGGSHQLVTSIAGGGHSSTFVSSASPKAKDGSYVFDPVWRYLYGAPAAPAK